MNDSTTTFIARSLWLFVGGLTGLTVSTFMDLAPRHVGFSIILSVGVVLLVLVNLPRRAIVAPTTYAPPATYVPPAVATPPLATPLPHLVPPPYVVSSVQPTRTTPIPPAMPADRPAPTLPSTPNTDPFLPPEGKLSSDAARVWLDDFLVRQQQK